MKNTNININSNTEDRKYISLLCQEQKDLILKTEYGVGRYQFTKFNELQGNLVLEFKLLDDNRYKDTSSINKNIGQDFDKMVKAWRSTGGKWDRPKIYKGCKSFGSA